MSSPSIPCVRCLALLGLALLAAPAQAQLVCLKAQLDGSQATPPNPSTATGTAWGIMDRQANTLSVDFHFSGIAPGNFGTHIHGMAPKGVGGVPPLYAPPLNTKGPGVWNYDEAHELDIIAGLTYWNVHSQLYVPGEIRGQFEVVQDAAFVVATLEGAQVVPPLTTSASGTGYVAIDTTTNTAVYRFDVSGFTGTETHAAIHGFAPPGSNAPVLVMLPLGNSKVGTWTYPEAHESELLSGQAYVEIRMDGTATGEIRGQLLPGSTNPAIYCSAKVNSCGTSPAMLFLGFPSSTAGTGFRVGVVNARGTKAGLLVYSDAGPANLPFQGGTLCVAPTPLKRGPPKIDSNGTAGQCDGVLSMDMNEFTAGLGGGSPAPFLTVPGTQVTCQWVARDTVTHGSLLSNALAYVVAP